MIKYDIAVPVWGAGYHRIWHDYTWPSLLAAMSLVSDQAHFTLKCFVDDFSLYDALPKFPWLTVEHYQIPWRKDVHPSRMQFDTFSTIHRQVLEQAAMGTVVALLNSDIVVSGNAFQFMNKIVTQTPYKALVSVAVRATPAGPGHEGKDPHALLQWAWKHRHPITEDCVWGRGKTSLATCIYFETGENVILHAFHLYPIMLIKDRIYKMNNTCDDDLIDESFQKHELYVATEREVGFAEISQANKKFNSMQHLVSVPTMVDFGSPRFRDTHLWLFSHRVSITGNPALVRHADAPSRILSGIRDRKRANG